MSNSSVELHGPDDLLGPAALAPVLGARKDGRENAETSRAMLLTVLGELARPAGRAAWTQSLIDALQAQGVEPKATRQAIGRLGERGWLRAERSGRRTRWSFTPALDRLLDDGAERIYSFGRDGNPWDGRWLIVLASISERQRQLRYRMTVGLSWAGFGSLGQGVWVSPWVGREIEARRVLQDLGVDGVVSFRAELGTLGEPSDIVSRSWDLERLRDRYTDFLDEIDQLSPQDDESTTRDLLTLVHRWRRFPFLDPGLPSELLPAEWPARPAARRFGELQQRWQPVAARWWQATESRYST